MYRGNILCFTLCPLPLVLAQGTTERAWFHLYSLQAFIHAGKIPAELSLLQTDLSSPSLSPQERCCSSLDMLVTFCWALSSMSMRLFYWRAQNRPQHFRCWVKGWCVLQGLPQPAGNALAKAELPFLHRQTPLLAHAQQSKVSVQLGGTQEMLVHKADAWSTQVWKFWQDSTKLDHSVRRQVACGRQKRMMEHCKEEIVHAQTMEEIAIPLWMTKATQDIFNKRYIQYLTGKMN